MSEKETETGTAIELGRAFFVEVVRPAMAEVCPQVLECAACGRFGWGSECFGLDDAISRDHHWGPRVDVLLPDEVLETLPAGTWTEVASRFPSAFRGFRLEKGHVGGAGLSPDGIRAFLGRTIGRADLPNTAFDWLDMPEEDISHVINGEIWHDPGGRFTRIREVLGGYYPDDVWKRRIAHWCRYASGMGLYAMKRAVLRGNTVYCHTAFGRTIQRTLELGFLLNRTYFPYDKWLYPCFRRLEHLAPEMTPGIDEATDQGTGWQRRIEIFEQLHTLLDQRMVELGLVRPHPAYTPHETSGYRLLEWCYRDLLRSVPEQLVTYTPLWDQKFLEQFVSALVAGMDEKEWLGLLNLDAP